MKMVVLGMNGYVHMLHIEVISPLCSGLERMDVLGMKIHVHMPHMEVISIS